MNKRRERNAFLAVRMEMTPMIDVVFQLLIFFIVSLSQQDILSHLDISRGKPAVEENRYNDLFRVTVCNDGLLLQGKKISLTEVDRKLMSVARLNKTASIVVQCTADSPHASLVQVLDICGKAGLSNVAVGSL